MAKTENCVYVVLLYPPYGVPRVCEIPRPPKGLGGGLQTFRTLAKAEAALEKFLSANPEYRAWKDGRLGNAGAAPVAALRARAAGGT